MANYAFTTFKVTGPRKQVKELADGLKILFEKSSDKWVDLWNVAEYFKINPNECDFNLRGEIYGVEYEEDNEKDSCVATINAASAHFPCLELFDEINSVLGGELRISYRWYVSEQEIYYVHDIDGLLPEECVVHSMGGPFGEERDWEAVATVREAIDEWVAKTGIPQVNRTDDEMLDFINNYDYSKFEEDDDDWVFYTIYRFVPE